MSDYKLTRDAAGKVTTQYGQMLQNLEDDLVKRARHNANADMPHHASVSLIGQMADRIEELDAKLAKAVEALGGMVGLFSGYSLLLKGMHLNMELDNARTTLAELNHHSRNERTRR